MATVTLKSSGGDYTLMSAWEAALPATLTAVESLECYDFLCADDVAFVGVTTSASFYLRIYGASGQRHDGRSREVSGTGFNIQPSNTEAPIRVGVNHIRFDGLDVDAKATFAVIFSSIGAGSDVRFENCILRSTITGTGYLITTSAVNLNFTLRNCIAYASNRTIDTRAINSALIENCTLWRHAAQLGVLGDTELVVKNTYSGHTGAASEDFWTGGAAPSGNNNASSDTSQATDYTAGVSSVAGSSVFTSVTVGAEDFRLLAGTNALVEAGATLGSVTVDAIGTARPQGALYDIGAIERSAGVTIPTLSLATLTSITATTARPRVSVTFP